MQDSLYDILEMPINVILIFSTISLAVIPLRFEILDSTPISISDAIEVKPNKKRLTKMGTLFVICAIITVGCGMAKFIIDSHNQSKLKDGIAILQVAHANDSMQHIVDEIKRDHQANIVEKKVDSSNGLLNAKNFQYENLSLKLQAAQKENLQLQKEFNSPELTEGFNPTDIFTPHLKRDSSRNAFIYWIYYKNAGKGIAKNIRTSCLVVSGSSLDKFKVIGIGTGRYQDKDAKLEAGESSSYAKFLDFSTPKASFLCLEIRYRNALGEERPPYRRIYYFDSSFIDKDIPHVTASDKQLLELYMLKNGYWVNNL